MRYKVSILLLLCLMALPAMAQRPLTIVGGVVTANVADTNDFQVALTANVTGVTLISTTGTSNSPVTPATGYQITMRFVQDATGSRTVAFGGNISTACTVNATANAVTICRWQYTASTNLWADAAGSSVSPSSPIPANQAQGPRFNVKNYGAIGDAQHIVDGVTAGSSGHTVTSATAQFAVTDIGKKIVCAASGNGTPLMPISTITARNSATQVTVSGAGDNGAAGGLACIWYTADDTAAFQAANTAALPSIASVDPNIGATLGTAPGTVYCPEGGYAVSGRIFTFAGSGSSIGPSFVGAGKNKCLIYLIPGMTDPNDGFSVLFNFYNGVGFKWEGFGVDGLKFGFSFTHPVVQVTSSQQWTLDSIRITNVSTSGANGGTLDFNASANGLLNDVFVQGAGSGNDFACSFGNGSAGIIAKNLLCSNHNQALRVTATGQRTVFGPNGIVMLGGTIDECGSTTLNCTIISSNGILNAHDTTFMVGFTNRSAISVDATSILYGNNISCGQYGSTTVVSNCLLGASGGQAFLTSSDLRGNGVGGLSVSGPAGFQLFDLGGNKYLNCVSGVCSPGTFAQNFGGGVFPVFPLPSDAVTQLGGRQTVTGTAPTFAVTGFGTSPTVTVQTGSTDAAGAAIITAGTTPGSSGTFTLTFSTLAGAYGTNKPVCTFTLIDGTGAWNALAQEPRAVDASTSTTSVLANWNDNSIALTAASTYGFNWSCYGK